MTVGCWVLGAISSAQGGVMSPLAMFATPFGEALANLVMSKAVVT